MLLTSGQVSLAISSTVVFIFTTALFLCGYVVQQKTVNDIREAIKPQPRPVHTNLYVPPNPYATPGVPPPLVDGVQIIEVIRDETLAENADNVLEDISLEPPPTVDEEERLVQGADGGFLKKQRPRQRQRKQETLLNRFSDIKSGIRAEERPNRDRITDSESVSDTLAGSGERLSRAARRKLIKDEFVKLAGEDLLNNANTYKRRRLW